MSKLIERECSNCGATIKIDSKLQIVKCKYCNTEFELLASKNNDKNRNRTSIDTKTYKGETALMDAVFFGNIEEIKALIEEGADVNTVGEDGDTALILPFAYWNSKIGASLISLGALVKVKNNWGHTALGWHLIMGILK